MAKSKQWKIVIPLVLILIIIIGIGGYLGFTQQSAFFDDYLIEDDFSIPSPALIQQASFCQESGSRSGGIPTVRTCEDDKYKVTNDINKGSNTCGLFSSTVNIVDEGLELTSVGDAGVEVIRKADIKNNDIKIRARLDVSSAPRGGNSVGGFYILLNDKTLYFDQLTAMESVNRGSTTQTKEYLIEFLLDFEDENIYHVLINGAEVKSVTVPEKTALLTFRMSPVGGSCTVGSAKLRVEEIKSRPYFNCEVDTDEVVVRDVFTESSSFTIKDLTYKPTKFCVDSYPAIKRSFTDNGVRADIQGQTTKKLTTGQTITVGEKETLEIYYIADYTEGMGLRCGLDSAYDTKTKQCVKIIEEQADTVTFINQKEFITIGKKQLIFKDSLTIADREITSIKPSYLCAEEDGNANAPDPRPECWQTTISYNIKDTLISYGEEKEIIPQISLKYLPKAEFEDNIVKEGYENNLILTIKNDDVLDTNTIPESEDQYYVLFSEKRDICFTVKSNVGNFRIEESGVQIKTTKKLLTQQETKQNNLGFTEREQQYCIPIDSNEYGRQIYDIITFYKINGEIFFDDEKITRSYEIVDTIPHNVTIIKEVGVKNTAPVKEISITVLASAIIGIIALFILFVYFVSRRK